MRDGERRLAAIMFTDVVGFASRTQRDESGTIALLRDQRKMLRPSFESHGGREVKTIGDAFLVEFSSALDAVLCAVAIQNMMNDRRLARGDQLQLRIGIHVGDVIEGEKDVLGDAVNIASRIEPLAEPGGICVSEQVYDQIRNKVSYPVSLVGKRELKNVSEPVEVYRILLPWNEQVSKALMTGKLDRMRIAVLPLISLSPDPADEYFADGTTEEMISTLSNISGLTVISRTSVMQYKGVKKNLADIGLELKAGTMLEGSVRKAGNRVRVTVQLLDSNEDKHLWSQSYDRDLHDVFAVQSDIAKNVAHTLRVKLLESEASQIEKRPTENTEAYLLYLKGRQHWSVRSNESTRRAIEYFTLATERDPSFALAYVGLADSYIVSLNTLMMTSAEAAARARPAVLKALELDDGLAEAHSTYAWILSEYDWNWSAAEAEFKKAIQLNTNCSTAHQWYSLYLRITGRRTEALSEAKKALELDPLAPIMSNTVGWELLLQERVDEAIPYFEKTLSIEPDFPFSMVGLVTAYAFSGRFENALSWWKKLRQISPFEARDTVLLAIAQALAGRKEEAVKTLDSAMPLPDFDKVPKTDVAEVFAALHDVDRALDFLEMGLKGHEFQTTYVTGDPLFKQLHSNLRFQEILKKMGLDKY